MKDPEDVEALAYRAIKLCRAVSQMIEHSGLDLGDAIREALYALEAELAKWPEPEEPDGI